MSSENKARTLWLQELDNRAPSTQRIYQRWMGYFLKRWNIRDEEELYRLRLNHLSSGDPRDSRQIEVMCKTLMAELVRGGMKPASVRHLPKALKSFFEAQNQDFKISNKDKPRGESIGRRIALRDDIRELYDAAGSEHKLRNRAILMLGKDTGLRVSDLSALNVKDVLEANTVFNEYGEAFKILAPLRTRKTGTIAYPIYGPEAAKAIADYLEERKREGDKLWGDEPLFTIRGEGRISGGGITELLRRLAKHTKNPSRLGAHSLRKFHTSMLEMGGVTKNWITKLQGKSIGDSTAQYSAPEDVPGALTEAYIRAYDKLRVFGEGEAVERLRRELEEARAGQHDEIKELRMEKEKLVMEFLKLQTQVTEMTPAFRIAQKMIDDKREWDKLRESPSEP